VSTNGTCLQTIGGVNTTVARLQSELAEAQYDLDQTVTRTPGPGYVTQMALRPGMYVIPAPSRPAMVSMHTDDQQLAAAFQQNSLQRVRPGDEAEIAFDALPGQIIKGKVRHLIDAIATGQLQATGALQDRYLWLQPPRRLSGSGCGLRAICPSLRHHQANPSPHAELGELYFLEGHVGGGDEGGVGH